MQQDYATQSAKSVKKEEYSWRTLQVMDDKKMGNLEASEAKNWNELQYFCELTSSGRDGGVPARVARNE